jgi:ATP-dependent DNA helicase RecG
VLDPKASGKSAEPDLFGSLLDDLLPGVDEALKSQGTATAGELVKLTGLSRTAVLNRLRTLTETGTVVAVGAARSPKRRLPVGRARLQTDLMTSIPTTESAPFLRGDC